MKTGEIIKQYVIEYLIGSGSFGKVYKIHAQNDIKKIYALKEINIQYHTSKKYLETAIQREIEDRPSLMMMVMPMIIFMAVTRSLLRLTHLLRGICLQDWMWK